MLFVFGALDWCLPSTTTNPDPSVSICDWNWTHNLLQLDFLNLNGVGSVNGRGGGGVEKAAETSP